MLKLCLALQNSVCPSRDLSKGWAWWQIQGTGGPKKLSRMERGWVDEKRETEWGDVKHRESGSRGVRRCLKRFRKKGSRKGEEERRAVLKMRSGRKCRFRRGSLQAYFPSLSLNPPLSLSLDPVLSCPISVSPVTPTSSTSMPTAASSLSSWAGGWGAEQIIA